MDALSRLKVFGAQGETLSEIYLNLLTGDVIETLDPLDLFSPLLESEDEASWKILCLMIDKSSPREVILAANEALENLHRSIPTDESDNESDNRSLPSIDRIMCLIELYRDVISRVPLRKRGPGLVVQGFLSELESIISLLSDDFTEQSGRRTLRLGQELVISILQWGKRKEGLTTDELKSLNHILLGFIESVVGSLAHCIEASLAERAFLKVFPNLGGLHVAKDSDHSSNGRIVMSNILSLHTQIRGVDPYTLPSSPSQATLVLYAHWQIEASQSHSSHLSFFLPVILASIQTNTILDEVISLLLLSLRNGGELSPETAIPLSTVLPPLCSGHPDPSIRHYAFRTLSLLLQSTEPPLRMQILKDLTSDSENPPMRTAAVGLVKENVVAALNSRKDIFASPLFLKTFGSLLFVLDPPELFRHDKVKLNDRERNELARLTECLGLYYVLIVRDRANKTGIKDRDNLANVERALLKPMKEALPRWIENVQAPEDGHLPSAMPLVSLQLSLDRVYEALGQLKI